MTNEDPLRALDSSDAAATNRKQLAELVAPYAVIDDKSKEFSFLPPFTALNNRSKIELVLAVAKARHLLFDVEDGLTPNDIIALSVMPEGSVKSGLRNLLSEHKIKKDKGTGHYYIPSYRIAEIKTNLQE